MAELFCTLSSATVASRCSFISEIDSPRLYHMINLGWNRTGFSNIYHALEVSVRPLLAKKLTWLTSYLKRQSVTAGGRKVAFISMILLGCQWPVSDWKWCCVVLRKPSSLQKLVILLPGDRVHIPTPAKAPSTLWLHGFSPLCKDSWQVFHINDC